jgi:hypothetical protein
VTAWRRGHADECGGAASEEERVEKASEWEHMEGEKRAMGERLREERKK